MFIDEIGEANTGVTARDHSFQIGLMIFDCDGMLGSEWCVWSDWLARVDMLRMRMLAAVS